MRLGRHAILGQMLDGMQSESAFGQVSHTPICVRIYGHGSKREEKSHQACTHRSKSAGWVSYQIIWPGAFATHSLSCIRKEAPREQKRELMLLLLGIKSRCRRAYLAGIDDHNMPTQPCTNYFAIRYIILYRRASVRCLPMAQRSSSFPARSPKLPTAERTSLQIDDTDWESGSHQGTHLIPFSFVTGILHIYALLLTISQ